jgi:predicted DNA-binding protein
MATTTIRVDAETHARLLELSEATGDTLMSTVRDAAEALRRQRFGHQVAQEMEALRRDPAGWADYLADADSTAVTDGIS